MLPRTSALPLSPAEPQPIHARHAHRSAVPLTPQHHQHCAERTHTHGKKAHRYKQRRIESDRSRAMNPRLRALSLTHTLARTVGQRPSKCAVRGGDPTCTAAEKWPTVCRIPKVQRRATGCRHRARAASPPSTASQPFTRAGAAATGESPARKRTRPHVRFSRRRRRARRSRAARQSTTWPS